MFKFQASYGDQMKTVEVTAPNGGGGNMLHLYIDNFYKGIFLFRGGNWEWLPQDENKDDLQTFEIEFIIERIREKL